MTYQCQFLEPHEVEAVIRAARLDLKPGATSDEDALLECFDTARHTEVMLQSAIHGLVGLRFDDGQPSLWLNKKGQRFARSGVL